MEKRSRQSYSSIFQHFHRPILLLLSLAIFVAGYFLILKSSLNVYQENFGLLAKLNSDIKVASDNVTVAQKYTDKIYNLSPLEVKLLNMSMPLRPDDSSIVAQLTSLSQRAGFITNNINIEEAGSVAPNKKVSADHVGRVAVKLKLRDGGYNELKQLLKLMESSIMIIDVVSINFSDKAPTYDLSLVIYYYNNNSLSAK